MRPKSVMQLVEIQTAAGVRDQSRRAQSVERESTAAICLRRYRTTLQLRQITGAGLAIDLVLRPRQQLRNAYPRIVADRNLLGIVQRQLGWNRRDTFSCHRLARSHVRRRLAQRVARHRRCMRSYRGSTRVRLLDILRQHHSRRSIGQLLRLHHRRTNGQHPCNKSHRWPDRHRFPHGCPSTVAVSGSVPAFLSLR